MTPDKSGDKKIFSRDFAPHEGLVKHIEKPQRDEICLNGCWQFQPVQISEGCSSDVLKAPALPAEDQWDSTPLKVPSPWNVNGFSRGGGGDFRSYPSYPETWKDIKAGWLKQTIEVPADWSGARIILHFEAVAGYAKVYINGTSVGDHFDPFLPFHFEITEQALPGEELEILVWVAHGSLLDVKGQYGYRQYVAGSFWGSFIAGIWQDVYLQKMPEVYITDTFVKPQVNKNLLDLEITVKNTGDSAVNISLEGAVRPWINGAGDSLLEAPEINWSLGDEVLSLPGGNQTIPARSQKVFYLSVTVGDKLELWSPGTPVLYGLVMSLRTESGIIDTKYTRFGWRQFLIKGRQFLLNGKVFKIKADSWHFTGVHQMSRRYAYGWYRMLKEANGNGIRLHAQVYPRFYLEMADEMGMCILDETAIWHSDGGPKIDSDEYWQACRRHVKGLVLRDRNNPSVLGWSVCNETVEVAKMVFHAPKKIIAKNIAEIREWIALTRQYDPTRQWISGDGEIFGKTGLPTLIEHYAWRGLYPLLSLVRKPWGTGETGMAYYGTPLQVSKVNGHRAFESQMGRMEGLAGEAFDLIKAQRKAGSSYASVFNLVWYGLKPLPLGLKDASRPPQWGDGIFFGDYTEGKPGYQPERLGPYCNTLNPGYDPDLPLYAPWPLRDAVKAAYSDEYRKTKNSWNTKKEAAVKIPRAKKKRGVVLLSSDEKGKLKRLFENSALRFSPLSPRENQLIIIDGMRPPLLDINQKDILRHAVEQGSTLLFWKASEITRELIQSITGSSIEFYSREASSYLIRDKHPIVRKESPKSFYFSELSDDPTSSETVGGPWVEESGVILQACDTDWKKWNYQGEEVKTAKLYRSEQEVKPEGNVIVQQHAGKGEIIVSTLDLFVLSTLAGSKVAGMMKNLGAPLSGPIRNIPKALNRQSVLKRALIDSPTGENTVVKAGVSGQIGSKSSEPVEYSFWIYSLRSLEDLLIEPGIPRMDMTLVCDTTINCSINSREMVPCAGKTYTWEGIPLIKGWNKISVQASAPFKLYFNCTQRRFLKKIDSFVYK